MTGCPFLHGSASESDPASGPSSGADVCAHVLTRFYAAVDDGDIALAMRAVDDHAHFADGSGEWSGRRAVEERLRTNLGGRTDIAVMSVSQSGPVMTLIADVRRAPCPGSSGVETGERIRHSFRLSRQGWRLIACAPGDSVFPSA